MLNKIHKVCVYCASSRQADSAYSDAAKDLGRLLAEHNITLVYGGGSAGSMGALADAALSSGGKVVGIIPQFMRDLEWSHEDLTELQIVNDLHERKFKMTQNVDAIIALPGGSGTLEELLEAITWKRLGIYLNPIIIINVREYFNPLVDLLEGAIRERFMDPRHKSMWSIVERIEEVIPAIQNTTPWSPDAREFAAL